MRFRNQRPQDRRPPRNARRNATGPPPHRFNDLLGELASTRARYESMRMADGSLVDRAALLDRLHTLRADIAAARRDS